MTNGAQPVPVPTTGDIVIGAVFSVLLVGGCLAAVAFGLVKLFERVF